MKESNKNNRFNNIIKDLSSNDLDKVTAALKQMRKHGKKEAIFPLIELLANTSEEETKKEVTNLLYDLKDQTTVENIITAIEDEKFRNIKNILISIFWQSTLDGSQYISLFINEAIKSDYYTAIEVLTVIENFDATFSESEIEDLKYDLDEAISMEENEKINLLISIRNALDALNIEY